jgi:hypothetical protein
MMLDRRRFGRAGHSTIRQLLLTLVLASAPGCGGDSKHDVAEPGELPQAYWALRFGGSGDESAGDVALDAASNVYVSGNLRTTLSVGGEPMTNPDADNSSTFFASYRNDGTYRWSKAAYGSAGLTVDALGNVFVAGGLYGEADFGGGPLPMQGIINGFFASLAADGSHRWSRAFGDYIEFTSLTTDGSGNV